MANGRKTGGRVKGTPNKATADVRAAVAKFAENTAAEIETWLREIKDPARRLDAWARIVEYHIPKLGRQEITGPGGGPLQIYRKVYQCDGDTGNWRPSDQPAIAETPVVETAPKRDFEEL